MSSVPQELDISTGAETGPQSLLDLDEAEYEQVLHQALNKARRLANSNDFTEEVLAAKLAVLAIRQLHASNIYPRTAVRAMVLMEFDELNRSTGGAIARAKREIRDEDRYRKAEMAPGEPEPQNGAPVDSQPPKATTTPAPADHKPSQEQQA